MKINLKKIKNKYMTSKLINIFSNESSFNTNINYSYNETIYSTNVFVFSNDNERRVKWKEILKNFNFNEQFNENLKMVVNRKNPSMAIIIKNKKNTYLLTFGFVPKAGDEFFDFEFYYDVLKKIDLKSYKFFASKNNFNQEKRKMSTLSKNIKNIPLEVGSEIIKLKIDISNNEIKNFTNGELSWMGNSFSFNISELLVEKNHIDKVIDFFCFLEEIQKSENVKRESLNEKIEIKNKVMIKELEKEFIKKFEEEKEIGFTEDGFYFEEEFVYYSSNFSYEINDKKFTNGNNLSGLIFDFYEKTRYKNKIDFFKNKKINKYHDGIHIEKKPLIKIISLYFFYELKNYVLEEGKFYELKKGYFDKIDQRINDLINDKIILLKTDFSFKEKYDEGEIIKNLAKSNNDSEIFHKKEWSYNIEICDLAIKKNNKYEAIQIKKKTHDGYGQLIENINQSLDSLDSRYDIEYIKMLEETFNQKQFESYSLLFYFSEKYLKKNLIDKSGNLNFVKIRSTKFKLALIGWHNYILNNMPFNNGKIYISTFFDKI